MLVLRFKTVFFFFFCNKNQNRKAFVTYFFCSMFVLKKSSCWIEYMNKLLLLTTVSYLEPGIMVGCGSGIFRGLYRIISGLKFQNFSKISNDQTFPMPIEKKNSSTLFDIYWAICYCNLISFLIQFLYGLWQVFFL